MGDAPVAGNQSLTFVVRPNRGVEVFAQVTYDGAALQPPNASVRVAARVVRPEDPARKVENATVAVEAYGGVPFCVTFRTVTRPTRWTLVVPANATAAGMNRSLASGTASAAVGPASAGNASA